MSSCDSSAALVVDSTETIQGVVFAKAIRAYYAILHLGLEEEEALAIVKIQFPDSQVSAVRSWCRRGCKLGDLVQVKGQWFQETSQRKVFQVKVESLETAHEVLQVLRVRHWHVSKWQEWQQKHCTKAADDTAPQPKRLKTDNDKKETSKEKAQRHGGGVGKQKQGEYVTNFLVQVIMHSLQKEVTLDQYVDPKEWANTSVNSEMHAKALEVLNKGTGVIDAAGGSGYVSMALGLRGIQSTVVDPRASVGKLAKRDRKAWNRAVRNSLDANNGGVLLCQPVVKPYEALRAWFAELPPSGVDTSFRHPDEQSIAVCGAEHDLIKNCSAIVALHPDEATDAIVDMAVQQRIPFCVVPCCVFSRLFVHRRKPNSDAPVSTYEDLLDYLCAKHSSIQRTKLPFEGANIALWSVF